MVPNQGQGLQGHFRGVRRGADRHGQGVGDDVLPADAVLRRPGEDPLRDGQAALRRLRDTALVQGQGHHHAAVLPGQGKYRRHALLLAVDRVQHGLAVVAAQGPLHGDGVGGVDLERQVHHRLETAHRLLQHRGLVDLRQTHVHVQHLDALVLLSDALGEDVVHVAGAQGLLEPLLTGGVDPLADQHRVVSEVHGVGVGGHAGQVLGLHRRRHQVFRPPHQRLDIRRGGAAAAAGQAHALPHQGRRLRGELLRRHVVDRPAVLLPGQSRVGFQQHRHGGPAQVLPHHRGQGPGAQGAVDADGVGPHALQHGRHGRRGGAGHEFAVLAVGVGDEHRQITVLLGGQQCRLGLVAVVHGLDQNEVRAVFHAQAHGLGEGRHRVLEVQVTVGLQQPRRGRCPMPRTSPAFRWSCPGRRGHCPSPPPQSAPAGPFQKRRGLAPKVLAQTTWLPASK